MKKSKILLSLLAAGSLFTACNDLDQLPNGGVATEEQKKDAVDQNPALAAAGVNALPQQLINFNTIFGNHIDYGLPSSFLAEDCRGMDMSSADVGYNWYSPALEMSDFNGRYFLNLMCWYYNYYTIRSANTLLAGIDKGTENTELKYYLAQGYAFRAYCYFNLAQMYAFTYAANPDGLCVPIITEENMDDVSVNGCPRATVRKVYEQINDDLTEAIRLFESIDNADIPEGNRVNRSTMNASTPNLIKTFADDLTCYALRARANLFCCNYEQAAKDADKAIELGKAQGIQPISASKASVPGFDDINEENYIWGTYADDSERRYNTLVCWASHATGFQTTGYAGAGVYRCINKALYESIPTSDVRKGWWLDASGNPSSALPQNYANYIKSGYADVGNEKFPPYATVKFGAPEDMPSTSGAIDFPWIRIEEMYYIKAEAQAYTNLAAGIVTLNDFVRGYRDAGFTCNASDFESFRDIVWNQRRIEFWGEGLSYADIQRLQKPIDRRGGGYPTNFVLVVAPDDLVRLYDIPQAEIERNPLIVDGTHGASQPRPVADYE